MKPEPIPICEHCKEYMTKVFKEDKAGIHIDTYECPCGNILKLARKRSILKKIILKRSEYVEK